MKRLFQFGMLAAMLLAMFAVPAVWAQEEGGEAAAEPATEQVAAEGGATEEEPVDPDLEQEESAHAAGYWEAYEKDEIAWTLNNLWIMLAGCLVFIMHLGFASLECGLTRQKNTINIFSKIR